MDSKFCIQNAIQTPAGTVLNSIAVEDTILLTENNHSYAVTGGINNAGIIAMEDTVEHPCPPFIRLFLTSSSSLEDMMKLLVVDTRKTLEENSKWKRLCKCDEFDLNTGIKNHKNRYAQYSKSNNLDAWYLILLFFEFYRNYIILNKLPEFAV